MQLQFEVIDRLMLDVMKGFGAVPRRGAEVGGLLLGSVTRNEDGITFIKVDDFEPVSCSHSEGPSYLLSEEEAAAFGDAAHRWQANEEKRLHAVGYYRSHTRDGLCLAAEDLSLLDRHFPDGPGLALIIKPYATKASQAGFFFRENGSYHAEASPLEFAFRRKELGGGSSGMEKLATAARFGQTRESNVNPYLQKEAQQTPAPTFGIAPSQIGEDGTNRRSRSGWVWLPLSFIFMLLGVVLGFQVAITMRPKALPTLPAEAFTLSLAVQRNGNDLSITWDRSSAAVRAARSGTLFIDTADDNQKIALTPQQLQNGNVIYRSVPDNVKLRLELYPADRVSVVESLEYKTKP